MFSVPFDVILADPSWQYRNVKTGGSHTSGSAQKYPTMPVSEIAALPVFRLMNRDSVCFLWGTTPLGTDPFTVLDAWGYDFKTKWYWHKVGRKGTGYWTRGCVEEVLVGVRGKVKAWRSNLDNWIDDDGSSGRVEWALTDDQWRAAGCPLIGSEGYADAIRALSPALDGVFESKPEGHSRKPVAVRAMIETLTPGARRVELFSTQPDVPGWTHYGLDIDPQHDFRDQAFWEGAAAIAAQVEVEHG